MSDLISRAKIMAAMLRMGERVTFGSDAELIDELAAELAWKDAVIARLRRGLELIRDYPPVGGRRTADGYPEEVVYDEFAYRRIIDSYREGASRALAYSKEAPND